jgi:hypothetical protein
MRDRTVDLLLAKPERAPLHDREFEALTGIGPNGCSRMYSDVGTRNALVPNDLTLGSNDERAGSCFSSEATRRRSGEWASSGRPTVRDSERRTRSDAGLVVFRGTIRRASASWSVNDVPSAFVQGGSA